jgi:hypothetical protein
VGNQVRTAASSLNLMQVIDRVCNIPIQEKYQAADIMYIWRILVSSELLDEGFIVSTIYPFMANSLHKAP